MRHLPTLLLTCGLSLAAFSLPAIAQDGPPPGGNAGGDKPGAHPEGPPPGGIHLIPRFAADKIKLTDDQKKQIADLEEETKAKLDKILTPEQKKALEDARPPQRGQGGGPGGGRGGDQGGQQGGGNARPQRGPGGDAPPTK